MLDTLAQSGTKKSPFSAKPVTIVRGKGSDLADDRLMKGRGKRKIISHKLIHNLLKVAEAKEDSDMIRELWNAYHCQNRIITSSDRAYSNYCKSRFCTVCLGNRKAQIINAYFPVIEKWKAPYLVTLTSRSVTAPWLKKRMKDTLRALRIITERHRKRNSRGTGEMIRGIRSMECNFNPSKRSYNVHLHLIVPDFDTAQLLISEWLDLWTFAHAGKLAQHYRAVGDLKSDLIEAVKYGSKVFTQPDPDKKLKGKDPALLYAKAFYNIMKAMKGHRLFDRIGFNLPPQQRNPGLVKELTTCNEWQYEPQKRDWTNDATDETLTNYLPPPQLINYLMHDVNFTLE